MDPITLGLGVANVGGGILGYIGQRNTNKTNLKLAEQARTHDVNMWNMQNAYNTPAMQRQRLEEAGLNPNLLYDSGANAGNAGNVPTAPRPEVKNEMAHMQAINLLPLISKYQDWQVQKAQIDNLQAQRDAITEQTIGKRIENYMNEHRKPYAKVFADTEGRYTRSRADLTNQQALNLDLEYQRGLRTFDTDIQIPRHQLDALKLQNRQRKLDVELDEQLKPYKMHRGDELWQRLLLPAIMDAFDIKSLKLPKIGKILPF